MEDLLYISADLRAVDWPVVVAIRALSHLIHPLLAGLISLQAYSLIRSGSRAGARDRLLRTYVVAVVLHGLWNLPWAIIYQIRPFWDPLGGILDRDQADLGANLLLALVTALLYLPLVFAMWKALGAALGQLKVPVYASAEEEREALFASSWWHPVTRLTAFVGRQARMAALGDRPAGDFAPSPVVKPTPLRASVAPRKTANHASFRRRFAAWVLDFSVVFALPAGLALFLRISWRPDVAWWLPIALAVLLAIGSAVFLIVARRSIGKALLGLRIADRWGLEVGRGRLVVRELLAKPLSGVWLLFGFLWTAWDERKQGWHDLLAGTLVVKGRVSTAPSDSLRVDAVKGALKR